MIEGQSDLNQVEDGALFEEVASRLRKLYRREHGVEFLFGYFSFIFHEGQFQGIEDRPRFRRYRSLFSSGSRRK